VSGDSSALNQQAGRTDGQPIREEVTNEENPFAGATRGETWYQAIVRLNHLRERVRVDNGMLFACDLIRLLDRLACQTGFEPVGALLDGRTPDEFFRGYPEFNRLEAELARKICPANVSDVLTLIQQTEHYAPTRRIVSLMGAVYRQLLAEGGTEPEP